MSEPAARRRRAAWRVEWYRYAVTRKAATSRILNFRASLRETVFSLDRSCDTLTAINRGARASLYVRREAVGRRVVTGASPSHPASALPGAVRSRRFHTLESDRSGVGKTSALG
jgi:hypothetical protein